MSARTASSQTASRVTVVFIRPFSVTFESLIEKLSNDDKVELFQCDTAAEAVATLINARGGILLAHALDAEHIRIFFAMTRSLQNEIQKKTVRLILTSKLRLGQLFSKLENTGIIEILEEPVLEKSLQFKIARHVRVLEFIQEAKSSKTQNEPAAKFEHAAKTRPQLSQIGSKKKKAPPLAEFLTKLVDPLHLESDCWLLTRGSAKHVAGRWIVRLLGPGPSIGTWEPLVIENQTDSHWQWTPANPTQDSFIKEEGAWIFRGQKPEFMTDIWLFMGVSLDLSFFYEGRCFGSKLKSAPNGDLLIAQDSDQGLTQIPTIDATLPHAIRVHTQNKVTPPLRRTAPETPPPMLTPKTKTEIKPATSPSVNPPNVAAASVPTASSASPSAPSLIAPAKNKVPQVTQKPQLMPAFEKKNEESAVPLAPPLNSLPENKDPELETRSVPTPTLADLAPQNPLPVPPILNSSLSAPEPLSNDSVAESPSEPELPPPVQAKDPGRWSKMSPLALAFLVSEMISRRDRGLAEISRRYCAYLATALGDPRVELWSYRETKWSRLAYAESTHMEAISSAQLRAASEAILSEISSHRLVKTGAQMAIALHSPLHPEKITGALIIFGPDNQDAPANWLSGVGQIAGGLLVSAYNQAKTGPP